MAKSCESIFWTFEKTSFTHFDTEDSEGRTYQNFKLQISLFIEVTFDRETVAKRRKHQCVPKNLQHLFSPKKGGGFQGPFGYSFVLGKQGVP